MASGNFPKVYLYRRIVFAKLFIDTHYAEKIDLDHMANEAFFSKFHFIRLFYTLYKKTPHQYLSYIRIEKTKQLLLSDCSVSQTCYAVGFESVSSFTGLFKRMTGQTPSAYQKEQRQKLADMANAPLKDIPNCFAEMNGWVDH